MALNINGRMKVKTLRADFKKEFGLTLRVYDGRSFADDDSTLAAIRKGDSKGGEFAPRKNTKVGNLEDKIMEMFGIKTQVAGSDDSYLCKDELTLKAALEEDTKKVAKKDKKAAKKISDMEGQSSDTTDLEFKSSEDNDDLETSDENVILNVKTEPCGEYTFGKLPEDEIKELINCFNDDEALQDLNIYQYPSEYDDLGQVWGVASGLSGTAPEIDDDEVNYTAVNVTDFQIPYEQDGVYLIMSKPTKMSACIEINCSKKDFDSSKLEVKYQEINLEDVEDSYGPIVVSIMTHIEYDNVDYTDEMQDSFVDRGYNEEVTIFQIKGRKLQEIVKWNGDGIEWLSGALEADQKKMEKKSKKSDLDENDELTVCDSFYRLSLGFVGSIEDMLWPVDTPSLNVLVRNDSGEYYVMTEPNLPESHILSFEDKADCFTFYCEWLIKNKHFDLPIDLMVSMLISTLDEDEDGMSDWLEENGGDIEFSDELDIPEHWVDGSLFCLRESLEDEEFTITGNKVKYENIDTTLNDVVGYLSNVKLFSTVYEEDTF